MDKYTGENITTVVTDLRQPMDIKIFHPVVQPNGTNHCSDVDGKPVCDQFCFPKPWIKDSTTGLFTYVLIDSKCDIKQFVIAEILDFKMNPRI